MTVDGQRSNDDGPRQPSRDCPSRDHGLDRAADKRRLVLVLAGTRVCALTSNDKPKFVCRRRPPPGVFAGDGGRHRTLARPEYAESAGLVSLDILCGIHGVLQRFRVV